MKRMAFQGDNFVFPPRPGSASGGSHQGTEQDQNDRPQTRDGDNESHKGIHYKAPSYTASTLVADSPQVYSGDCFHEAYGIPHVPTPYNMSGGNRSVIPRSQSSQSQLRDRDQRHHHQQERSDDSMEITPVAAADAAADAASPMTPTLHRKPSCPASTLAPDSPSFFEKEDLGYDIKSAIQHPSPIAAKRSQGMLRGHHHHEEFILSEKGSDQDDPSRPRPLANLPSPIDEILASIPPTIIADDDDDEDEESPNNSNNQSTGEKGQQPSNEPSHPPAAPPPPPTYLTGLPLHLLTLSLSLIIFLVSLDRAIITPALPHITSDLHSPGDIGWYGSAYLISSCAFQPIFGRSFSFLSVRWLYLSALATFMSGSLVCGLAPTSEILIFGRGLAGLGAAGLLSGSFVVVSRVVELRRRPVVTGVVGLMYGVGATSGPLLGGVLTELVSWRWCFFINLPTALVTGLVMLLVFHDPPYPSPPHPISPPSLQSRLSSSYKNITSQLDIPSSLLLLLTTTFLFLSIDSIPVSSSSSSSISGSSSSDHPYIYLLYLTLFAVLLTFFLLLQSRRQKKQNQNPSSSTSPPPLIPPPLLIPSSKNKTIPLSLLSAFLSHGTMLIHGYFLPLWLQIVRGQSPLMSGVGMIPYCVSTATFSFLSGVWVTRRGTYKSLAVTGSLLALVGSLAIAQFKEEEMETAAWVGFEVLVGSGLGMMVQLAFTAVWFEVLGGGGGGGKEGDCEGREKESEERTEGAEKSHEGGEEPVAISLVTASQSLGGAVFVEVGNLVFRTGLEGMGVRFEGGEGGDGSNNNRAGGLGIPDWVVGEAERERLRWVYNEALTTTFWVAVPLCAVMLVACLLMDKKSVMVKKGMQTGDEGGERGIVERVQSTCTCR